MKKLVFSVFCFVFSIDAIICQTSRGPGNPIWLYREWMETAGVLERNPLSFDDEIVEDCVITGPWANTLKMKKLNVGSFNYRLESDSFGSYNSSYASGINDGAIWQGRGLNAAEKFGFSVFDKNFRVSLSLLGWYAQNQDFEVTPAEQTGTGSSIDYVQRYGANSYSSYSFEGSGVSYKNSVLSIFAGVDSYWFGPALYNPLMLSTTAAGFPNVKLGIGPLNTAWGHFETRLLYGQLKESAFFNSDSNDDYRFFSGLFLSYRPSFFNNLTVSASRTMISKWANLSAVDSLVVFMPSMAGFGSSDYGGDSRDQRFSLAFRLLFPSVGFETYGEWARNDFSPNFSTFLLNPNHSQAYMLGMRKTFNLSNNVILGIGYEMTELTMDKEGMVNLNGYGVSSNFYNHGIVTQGYTNDGQYLGSGIGGGSFVQGIFANLFYEEGRVGLFVSRLARNQTYIYSNPTPGDEYRMDVEMSVGIDADILWHNFIITPLFEVQTNMNRDYIYGNTIVNIKGSLLIKRVF